MDRQSLNSLLLALQSSLSAAIETCGGSQESQQGHAVVELRGVLLALLDSCADGGQGEPYAHASMLYGIKASEGVARSPCTLLGSSSPCTHTPQCTRACMLLHLLALAAKAKDSGIPTVLHVTNYVLERLPFVFGEGNEAVLLRCLLRLLLFVGERHRSASPSLPLRAPLGLSPLPSTSSACSQSS
jgi:hypothetical protein